MIHNTQRLIVNKWYIITLVFLMCIFLPSILGIEGMDGGYGISFLAGFMVMVGLIVIVIYRVRAKQMERYFRYYSHSCLSGSTHEVQETATFAGRSPDSRKRGDRWQDVSPVGEAGGTPRQGFNQSGRRPCCNGICLFDAHPHRDTGRGGTGTDPGRKNGRSHQDSRTLWLLMASPPGACLKSLKNNSTANTQRRKVLIMQIKGWKFY